MAESRQRPEGLLIGRAIDANPALSRRGVAEAVGMSEARVRQIINGYASAGRGQTVDVVAPSATLAKIALAVGLDEDQMERAGRADAASDMREQRVAQSGRGVILDGDRYEAAFGMLKDWMDQDGEESDTHPPKEALWLWTPRQIADHLAEQVALLEQVEFDMSKAYFHLLAAGKQLAEKESLDAQPDPAPSTRAGESPADDYVLAAMDRDDSEEIEAQQYDP